MTLSGQFGDELAAGEQVAQAAAREAIDRSVALGVRFAVAESLTGGLLAAALVSVPGASRAFLGGVVSYHTELKRSLLGVDEELLLTTGPVDGAVAQQMAAGVRRACAVAGREAEVGIATTGVAGPDPDQQTGQAPGTVWIGVSSSRGDRSVKCSFEGDREQIRQAAVAAAATELCVEITEIAGLRMGIAR